MILKRANNRYEEIKAAEKRLQHLHGQAFDDLANIIQKQRYSMACAEIGRNILDRAYGHSQAVALLHDVSLPGLEESINHILIESQNGEIFVISTQHLGSEVTQTAGNRWHANYGRDRFDIEDPRQRLRRQMTHVGTVSGKDYSIKGVALLPPDVRCENNQNSCMLLLRSDRFEAFLADRKTTRGRDLSPKLSHDKMLGLANLFIESGTSATIEAASDTEYLTTCHGTIRIKRLPNGHFALRNQNKPELIEAVRGLVRGQGWWNPKYHNWVIPPELMGKVRQHFAEIK